MKARDPNENISHRALPSFDEHKRFIYSYPYTCWDLIEIDNKKHIGSIYLSKAFEIGIHMFPEYRHRGYEKQAIQMLMLFTRRDRYFVNVSINNAKLTGIVKKLGFEHIQNTYEIIHARP